MKSIEPSLPEPTPERELASRISQALVEKGLVVGSKQNALAVKLANGQLKAEDWRNLIAESILAAEKSKGKPQ